MVHEDWVENKGVRLHYFDGDPKASSHLVPMVFIPGMLGSAEDYLQEMDSLVPRRCIAISLRGRGKSDSPQSAYTFGNHISDIEALVGELRLKSFCLMGYSVGVAYAIGYAVRHPDAVKGLVVGDYPAIYPAFGPAWAERVLSNHPGLVKPHAVQSMQLDSARVALWDSLDGLTRPVLILRGGQQDSLLPEEAVEMYQQHLHNVKVVVLEKAGHELSKPNYNGYIWSIRAFLESLDPAQQAEEKGDSEEGDQTKQESDSGKAMKRRRPIEPS